MAYIKNNWVDREGTTRYFETVDDDGALIFTPDYTQVTEMGTPVNADNMNHIEEGIASGSFTKFDLNATYFENDLVTVIEDGTPVIYKSLTNDNTGNSLANSSFWEKISLGGGGAGLEIGDIGIAPLGIDESLGKRRYLNGSILVQEQYPYFTQRVKTAIQTYASLGCTEEEWQTISNMSVGGQCGKFVVDDTAGTIRLPKIIMPIQGLTNLTNLGEIVSAGLPNITGEWSARQLTHLGQVTASGALYASANSYAGTSQDNNGGNAGIGLDASLSSAIYGNSNTVQQEQIQYPYFIQVATGSSYQENITNEIELNNPFVLLEGQYFTAPVYNSSWLQSNVSFTGSLALHPTAYNALLIEQNPNVEVGTTVDNYTKRGLSVKLDTEAYTDYDFVLNTTSQTFRCPLLNGSEDLPSARFDNLVLGESGSTYVAPANGWYYISKLSGQEYGWINLKNQTTGCIVGRMGHNASDTLFFSIFCKKGEVMEVTYQSTGNVNEFKFIYAEGNGSLYYYVGETVQNANLVNVGRVEEKIASLIPDNSDLIASYAMPSGRYIDLEFGADGTIYAAPANGWVALELMENRTDGLIALTNLSNNISSRVQANSTWQTDGIYIPVKKGDTFKLQYLVNSGYTLFYFRFIYAEGAK